MVAALRAGDRVEGFSGIHGTLTEVGERTVRMEVAPGVVITMARMAVASRIDDDAEEA
jgi:preprotein translocase subunit YajC